MMNDDKRMHLSNVEKAYQYPLFRRSANARSFYHIVSPEEMREIQIMGKYYMIHKIRARIMPERVLIDDISSLREGAYEAITEREFMLQENLCRETRILFNQP